ncbi:MAG: hypothetical protein JXR56_06945, partial [Candidatus Cloacimonetes bacterium]|nr:hypothetical protein [Candidatus Cloacimonadota bacterium]
IGNGSDNSMLPVSPEYEYSYSQCIYYPEEINCQNRMIESVWYHYNGEGVLTNSSEWEIYMGHTEQSYFVTPASWIPASQLTYVGTVNLSNTEPGDEWIELQLQTMFMYNGNSNLVIAIKDNTPLSDGQGGCFYSTHSENRSIEVHSNSQTFDVYSPPSGTIHTDYINVRLQFMENTAVPQNLNVSYSDNCALITWSNVITNESGSLINVSEYLIYGSNQLDFTTTSDNLIGISNTNSFVHLTNSRSMFYKVTTISDRNH